MGWWVWIGVKVGGVLGPSDGAWAGWFRHHLQLTTPPPTVWCQAMRVSTKTLRGGWVDGGTEAVLSFFLHALVI